MPTYATVPQARNFSPLIQLNMRNSSVAKIGTEILSIPVLLTAVPINPASSMHARWARADPARRSRSQFLVPALPPSSSLSPSPRCAVVYALLVLYAADPDGLGIPGRDFGLLSATLAIGGPLSPRLLRD